MRLLMIIPSSERGPDHNSLGYLLKLETNSERVCGGGFSHRGTVSVASGASDSPDTTFSLVSEPDMRLTLRFPLFVGLSGRLKLSLIHI